MRWRKIRPGLEEIRASDPHTALTECALRRMIASGQLPSCKIGRHILFDLDALDTLCQAKPEKQSGKIRPLPVLMGRD